MSIQHNLITDPNIHEPKGISLALDGDVYVADGLGSGVWKKPDPADLLSNTADFTETGSRLVVNGLGGIGAEPGTSIGVMTFTGNTTATALTDGVFATVYGPGAPWSVFVNKNATMAPASGSITAPVDGIYRLSSIFVADGTGFASNVKTRFTLSGGGYSPFENIFSRLKNDKGTLIMEMITEMTAGQTAAIQIAGDGGSGSVLLMSGAFRIEYLGTP